MSETSSVAGAIRSMTDQPPDWILLDLMLPDGCGTEILRAVRTRALASKTCLITGCGPERLRDARREGAEHIFTKPLDLDGLMTLLSNSASAA